MIRNCFFAALFAGLLGASCAKEESSPQKSIAFSGLIRSGDTNSPVANVNVYISVTGTRKGTIQGFHFQDSTQSNASGKYDMSLAYSDSVVLNSYSISASATYAIKCFGNASDIMPWALPVFSKADSLAVNTDTLTVCATGNIRLKFSRLSADEADTLFYQSIPQVIGYNIIGVPWEYTVKAEEVLLKLFTRTTTGVKFNFRIKKESGSIMESSEEVDITKGVTKELNVTF